MTGNHRSLKIYIDGASRGNPGVAGVGIILKDERDNVVLEKHKYLGTTTNNTAEYMAFILAIEEAFRLRAKKIKVFSDSQLLVKQMSGEYKVREEHLKELYQKALRLLKLFEEYDIIFIPREHNKDADALANKAIDECAR